jgi:bifunctional DNA-binding transcriptional regulator/antitoxin component of YhaV-PrlF toxin-antitoxin module
MDETISIVSTSAESKVTDSHQTQVPSEVRQRFHVQPGDVVVWEETPEGDLRVRFRRRHSISDLTGLIKGGRSGNAVEDKKRAQRGET